MMMMMIRNTSDRMAVLLLLLMLAVSPLIVVEAFQPSYSLSYLFNTATASATTSTISLKQQKQQEEESDNNHHYRVDVIDPDPDVAIITESPGAADDNVRRPKVQRFYETFKWKQNEMTDRDYSINYRVEGSPSGPPILLVHGFGANVNHFRYQFPTLVDEGYRVYAVDLLGFGGSDKPKDANYSIELFVKLLEDFVQEMNMNAAHDDKTNNEAHNNRTWIVAGNSIGGLCSLGLADRLPKLINAIVLFNTSGGMSSFRYEQWPILLRPIMWLVRNYILNNPERGGAFFENFKTRENVQSILMTQGVYGNTTNVDDELLEILLGPADDDGARDVFLKVFGGDPGPTPESFLAKIECPVLALWGEADPWTVIAMGEAFGKHAKGHYRLERLPGAGHCPHDEAPELVHEIMLPWLRDVVQASTSASTSGTTTVE